ARTAVRSMVCITPPRRGSLALPGPHDLVVADGLLGADDAVAVEVDLAEHLRRAEELAEADVAVAVDVHLAEPQRAARLRPGGLRQAGVAGLLHVTLVDRPRLHHQPPLPRHGVAAQSPP